MFLSHSAKIEGPNYLFYFLSYAEATQSDLLEGKIVGIPPNVGKIGAESGKRSVDLEAIKKTLLSGEVSKFSKVSNTPPDTSFPHNPSNFISGTTETEPVVLSTWRC